MEKQLFKMGVILFLVAVVVTAVASVTGAVEIGSISNMVAYFTPSADADSVCMAIGIVAGSVVTDGNGNSSVTPTVSNLEDAGLVDPDLDKDISLFNPDRYSLDTITRNHLRKRVKAIAQKVQYPQMGYKPMSDVLDPAATGSGLTLAAPCSAFAASTSNQATKVYIKPLNPVIWREHDTLLMRDLEIPGTPENPVVGVSEKFTTDVQFWVSKKEGDYLELTPTNGMKGTGANAKNFIAPTFTANAVLYRMGQAKSELAMQTDPFAMNPELFDQFCQNFMAQIEESTFQAITDKKVDISFNDYEAENIYSMRGEMEASMFWGARHEIKLGNDSVLFTGGICRCIDKILEYGTGGGNKSLTKEQYTQWLASLFTGNCGSKERTLFAGAQLISAIELLRESEKTIGGTSVQETYLGVKCTSIVSTFGTLHIVHDPLFDETGWGDRGVAIDLEHLYKKVFIPMHADEVDLKGSGQKNAKAKVLQEVSCLILRYPDCHAIIRLAA